MGFGARGSRVSVRGSSPVLVGRGAELETLTIAAAGAPSVVFVEGEAGVGKSRLVAELVTGTREKPVWVTVGYCQPLSEPFPYGVIFECLRSWSGPLGELSPVTGALRRYLPELAERLPEPPEPLGDPVAERHRLFRAVRELLDAVGPALVVIEDVHWADDGTRQMLRFIMSNPPRALSLVVTFRREDLPGDSPLGRAFRPTPGTTSAHLVLGPLDAEGVRGLVEAILGGRSVSPEFAEIMRQRTAGLPFVVEETTRALQDLGGDVHDDSVATLLDDVGVPALLREALLERTHSLSDAARSVAEAAAVLGVPASAELLGDMAGVDGWRHLAQLLESAVLVEFDENRYGYRHALAQRAAYDSLPGPRRADLHLRALEALSRLDPPPLIQLASHAKRAGLPDDWLRHSEDAADAAMEAGDAATAIELLRAVVAEPGVVAADVDRLAIKLCENALTGLYHEGVIAQIEDLLTDPRLSADAKSEVRLWLGLLLIRTTGELSRGRAEIEAAIASQRYVPERLLRGMSVLAIPYLSGAPLSVSRDWLRRLEERAEELPPGANRTALLANILGARVDGDPEAWSRIDRLMPQPADADSEHNRQLARLHCNLADACSWVGHYERAATFLRTGLNLASRSGASYAFGTAEATRIRLDWACGDWAGLDDRADRLAQVYAHMGPVTSELHLVKGWLATARGDWDQAEADFTVTGMTQPESAIFPVAIAAYGGMITMLLNRDDPGAACAFADRAVELLRQKGVWAWTGEVAPPAVEAYLAAGRTADAGLLVDELCANLDGLDAPLASAAVIACRARLARAAGDHAEAARLFEDAIDQHERMGIPYRVAQLREQLARGEQPDGAALNELARSYEELGATMDAARCRALARATGAATPSRRGRRGYGNELSPREREVARLLVGGQTNREIAQAMFLSRRTVEEHVANILRKLGVSSRQDIRL
ncbi:ATP-binding protein [Spirillospora sp. CA-294931]|uniref:ATP-binding protein n=1 Tax=Spirillospora sp. CA-294931 TaxID=3240042 RepID=UPI003D89BE24